MEQAARRSQEQTVYNHNAWTVGLAGRQAQQASIPKNFGARFRVDACLPWTSNRQGKGRIKTLRAGVASCHPRSGGAAREVPQMTTILNKDSSDKSKKQETTVLASYFTKFQAIIGPEGLASDKVGATSDEPRVSS